MKKFIATLAVVSLTATMGTALANEDGRRFSDEGSFSNWFTSAAHRMAEYGLITGHEDGSFRANTSVNRAELAVILNRLLERLESKMEDKMEDKICTMEFRYGHVINLYDQQGNPIIDATITVEPFQGEMNDDTPYTTSDDSGTYVGIGEGKGLYTVTIEKEGYVTHVETITLDHDGCHVLPQIWTRSLIKKASE